MYVLNERIKKELLEEAEKTEIDVTQLDSYHHDRNPYGVEDQLIGTSSCFEWSEREEWQAKVKKLAEDVKNSGVIGYCNLSDEEEAIEDEVNTAAYLWLLSLVD